MSSVLLRVAHEKRVAQMPTPDRAYESLKLAVLDGSEITLSNHELVMGIARALWHHELATVQYGLAELEIRTAPDAGHEHERWGSHERSDRQAAA